MNKDQKEKVEAILEEWRNEIDRKPEGEGFVFDNKKAVKKQRPHIALRNKYMPMIEAIKNKSKGNR